MALRKRPAEENAIAVTIELEKVRKFYHDSF